MSALPDFRIAELLEPYLSEGEGAPLVLPANVVSQLSTYLDLLLRWNAKTNLTAIRGPEAIVQRHFGESLFVARHLLGKIAANAMLLDFGSGAGFPGLPIQLALPQLRVTLAESQGKKASFLREAVRTLGLTTEIWAARVEDMSTSTLFDAVTMRAVDNMPEAVDSARKRLRGGGLLVAMAAQQRETSSAIQIAIPNAETVLRLTRG